MKGRYFAIAAFLVVATFLTGVAIYSKLPVQVPVHWNLQGQPDRFDSKLIAITVLPCVMVGVVLLFAALPWLSPQPGQASGTFAYLKIMLVILAGMYYFHALTLLAAMKGRLDIPRAVVAGVCLLIAGVGTFLRNLPRNFYVGVRTPWTIANEEVWRASHRLAAKTFVAGGSVAFILALAGLPVPVFIAPIAAGALVPVVYSLIYYKQLEHRGQV